MISGVERCSSVFYGLVDKGDELDVGFKKTQVFTPTSSDQIAMGFDFYCIDAKPRDVQYCTDVGVESLGGGISVAMPDTTDGLGRVVELTVEFGGTELNVSAKDKTSGNTYATSIRFLSS